MACARLFVTAARVRKMEDITRVAMKVKRKKMKNWDGS
jgi:hypothetical protein